MNYRIKRGDQEFGPYTLAEVRQYASEGRIIPTDLLMSENVVNWTPVSEVMGDLALPLAAGTEGASGGFLSGSPAGALSFPPPPDLHWVLVLLVGLLTCGVFIMVWMFVHAIWAKKIHRENKALWLLVIYLIAVFTAAALNAVSAVMEVPELGGLAALVNLGGGICAIVAYFKIKGSMESRFGGPPLHLRMNGILTFFFNVFYIQYHLSRISRWQKTRVVPA